jgi:predicted nuclease of predicted toxin-antitoxin system
MIAFYFDVHVRRAVAIGLRLRGIDVLTAQEDGAAHWDDARILRRATELGRVVFSQDVDLLREARACHANEVHFAGVVFGEQLTLTVGKTIQDLELIGRVYDPEDIASRVEYLPL